jgi:uncharacterized Rmd1/YagE family protein
MNNKELFEIQKRLKKYANPVDYLIKNAHISTLQWNSKKITRFENIIIYLIVD